jgi:hypothetical protein
VPVARHPGCWFGIITGAAVFVTALTLPGNEPLVAALCSGCEAVA